MELIKGTVNNSRHSTDVRGRSRHIRGRGYKTTVSTNQIAIFKLDNRPVEMRLSESIVINDGDQVVVAGNRKKGILQGFAYLNFTTGASGHSPIIIYVVYCIIMLMLWLILPEFSLFIFFKWIALFGAVSYAYLGIRNLIAVIMVNRAT